MANFIDSITAKKHIMRLISFIVFFVFQFLINTLTANVSDKYSLLSFKHLDRNKGLINSEIRSIYQDRKGFIFIGTEWGLHLYDGNRVRVFTHDPQKPNSLPANEIRYIVEDPDSNFVYWIATENGLCRFNLVKNKYKNYFRLNNLNKYTRPPSSINCLYVDSYGNIWVGFQFNGLKKYDTTTKQFITFKNNPHDSTSISGNRISGIFEDDNGDIWVIANNRINKYTRNTGRFTRYTIEIPEKLLKQRSKAKKAQKVMKAARGKNNILWLGFKGEFLCRFNMGTGQYTFLEDWYSSLPIDKNLSIICLLEDHTGTLWVGTTSYGLIEFNPKTKECDIYMADKHIDSGISSNQIGVLYEDKNSTLWIGAGEDGVDYFLLPQKGFHNMSFFQKDSISLEHSRVFSMLADKDSLLWIGFVNGGLLRINLKNNKRKYYYTKKTSKRKYKINNITSVVEDSLGLLWIGMVKNGLLLFNKKTEKVFSPLRLNPQFKILTRSSIFCMYKDKDDDIWIGTSARGLFHYDRYNNILTRYEHIQEDSASISSNYIRCIYQDSSGYIWIGTHRGLDKLNKYTQKCLKHYNWQNDIPYAGVNAIFEDKVNNLWIGTTGGLVYLNPRTNEQRIFNTANGFLFKRVKGILSDAQGNLWISIYKGLIYFNTQYYTFNHYTAKDGLLDDGFNNNAYFKSKEGLLYFGHHEGITYFKPEEIEYGKRVPEIVITDFRSESASFPEKKQRNFSKFVMEDSRLEFPHNQHTFYIEFTVLDYTNPSQNQYAYKLEGIDKEWRFLNNRNFLSLINIPPGEYSIHIIGASSRGVWNEKGIVLNLVVLPPYWQAWWFRSLIGLFILLITYMIFYLRMKQVKKRNRELEQINARLNEQISVRKHVENMLRLSEEKYKKLVSSIEYFIVTCGKDGIITFINDAFAKELGDEPEKFIGKSLLPYIPDSERERFEKEVEQVLNTGASTEYDVDIEIESEKRYYHVNLQPLKEFGQINQQVLMVVADVTRRRNLEEQLRQSQKMEAIGKLAGGIAHDFNNLIAIIRGYSDIVLSEIDEENELYESVSEIDKAGERAAALVRQLLAFSRRQILQPKVLDVNQLIRDMEKMLNRLIRENVELWFRLDPNLGNIYADPGQIEQVIMNLVLNARDAMPKGGKISIETQSITAADSVFKKNKFMVAAEYVMIEVRDTGMGIKKELHTKIFDPFFTTKEKGEGTGLGLSTVFGIVKQSKGYILLESEEEKGTSFKIFFPKVDEVITFARQSIRLNRNLQGSETILIVEDEDSLRKMICKMFTTNGYKILEAANGAQALSLLEDSEEKIDLLLTDVVMPGMSGKDLADLISERRPDIAVLFMSGYTDDEIVHQGILFPDTYYIQKPFTPEALGKKIRETLKAFKKTTVKP